MAPKIKDKKYFIQFYKRRKLELRGIFVDRGSGSGVFPYPGDPKRQDPTDPDTQHWIKQSKCSPKFM